MQSIDKAFEDKLYCELHYDCKLLAICFQEQYKRKSRLLCAKCMIDAYSKQEISDVVLIQDFINGPTDTILKVIKQVEGQQKFDENENEIEILSGIEKLLVKLEDSFNNHIIVLKQIIKQMRSQVCSIITQLSNNLKLNNLVQQFELIKRLDSYQGTREQAQLEEQLNQISANMKQVYVSAQEKVKDNQLVIANNFKDIFQTIQNQVESTVKVSLEQLNKVVPLEIPKILEDINLFPQIHYLISQGKQIKYELLYQGSRDGLNAKAYWSKCNQKSNLLTIMTSKNGSRFGGYSPCFINSTLQYYVKDPTMKSFLFQYNKKEIYKLKNQAQAVYCYANYGPTYGGGYDIYVAADFNSGGSNLGNGYEISGYNIIDKATHIFGDKTPQLQEIKVYKAIFQ